MSWGYLIILSFIALSQASTHTSYNTSFNTRQDRFFPFLSLAKFPNEDCMADTGEMGTCYSKKQCRVTTGVSSGTCANGFGVCCLLKKNCSANPEIVKSNGTHLVNPVGQPGICRYEINKMTGVCQIKLDFIKFQIKGADSFSGTCNEDTLTVSGAVNAPIGNLCGNLDSQHMYLNYGNNDRISINIFTNSDSQQMWDIKVTYIRCDSMDKAPSGCLQYFTEAQGSVKSFNYPNTQLTNQDYSICIKDSSMRRITWKTCGGPTSSDFVVSGQPPAVGLVGAQWEDNRCVFDWVEVFGVKKYCGSAFPDSVSSSTQPFILGVKTNAWELPTAPEVGVTCSFDSPQQAVCMILDEIQPGSPGDTENTGFCLRYQLMP